MTEQMMNVTIDCETGEKVERPLTPEEIEEVLKQQENYIKMVEEEALAKEAMEIAKASAQAKLTALGLTAEEIAALSK